MLIKNILASFLFLLMLHSLLLAQKGNPRQANAYLTKGNFDQALEEYLLLLEDEPGNLKYNYRAGVCYLNSNIDKGKAIPFLEKVVLAGYDNNAYYLLGRAYHFALQFDKAIEMFGKYKTLGGGTAASIAEADKQIEYCHNAKEIVKFPLDVTFENLGANINSLYPDYYPFVPVDESYIVFNSKRDDGSFELENGHFTANVYMSKVINGEFQKAFPLGNGINTADGNEEVSGLSANGDIMLVYFDNFGGFGDLYITRKRDKGFEKPVILEKQINSHHEEIAASITRDGNTIYFASNRKGGYGGTDIYVSRKLPIGGWGPAQNLGPDINTEYDEDFPNISPDNATLYFSSKGHTSMGGYDIFKADWDKQKRGFVNVRNVGYPVNTALDDMNLRISETGRYGYIAAVRPEGLGDYDIYRVTFNEVEPRYTVIKGIVNRADTTRSVDDIYISVTDKSTGEIYGEYLPNPVTMRYIMILPPGLYQFSVEAGGFRPIEEDIQVYDKASFMSEIQKDIVLKNN